MGCEGSAKHAVERVADAQQLQQAAEAETDMYRHLGESNETTKKQNELVHVQLRAAMAEHANDQHTIAELQNAVVRLKDLLKVAHDQNSLMQEHVDYFFEAQHSPMRQEVPRDPSPVNEFRLKVVDGGAASPTGSGESADVAELSLSDVTSIGILPVSPQVVFVGDGVPVNVSINLDPTDKNNWGLLERVQITITKKSKLDIQDPTDAFIKFIAAMEKAGADHEALKVSVARYKEYVE
jgi:hypothetical protein